MTSKQSLKTVRSRQTRQRRIVLVGSINMAPKAPSSIDRKILRCETETGTPDSDCGVQVDLVRAPKARGPKALNPNTYPNAAYCSVKAKEIAISTV